MGQAHADEFARSTSSSDNADIAFSALPVRIPQMVSPPTPLGGMTIGRRLCHCRQSLSPRSPWESPERPSGLGLLTPLENRPVDVTSPRCFACRPDATDRPPQLLEPPYDAVMAFGGQYREEAGVRLDGYSLVTQRLRISGHDRGAFERPSRNWRETNLLTAWPYPPRFD